MRIRLDVLVLIAVLYMVWFAVQKEETFDFPLTSSRTLETIMRSGELVILTQNSPITYYLDRDGNESGPEYEVAKAFAEYLGVKPTFVVKNSVAELLSSLEKGEGDLASAGLTITENRKARFLFGPEYQKVSQQVVCRRGGESPRNIIELLGVELTIIGGSSYEESLNRLKEEQPELSWTSTEGVGAEQLLENVWNRSAQCTVMDSTIVAINQRYLPELKVRFNISKEDGLAWALPNSAKNLQESANNWFSDFKQSEQYASIQERYYGHVDRFDYVDTSAFIRRIDTRYSKYRSLFIAAAESYNLSEVLLAAQSYQESHWNPRAKSPTGVRGIMMLTLPTAKAMGVTSRLDAAQNIEGGAKYLAKLKKLLSTEIEEPDLTWIALAAYNVGLGHVKDAQQLARTSNKNPTKWHDLKIILPFLSQKRFYKKLRYGYARGSEPVRYVQRIREYEHILNLHLLEEEY